MVTKEQMKVGVVVKITYGDLIGIKVKVTRVDYKDNTFKGIPLGTTEESTWYSFSQAELFNVTRNYLMEQRAEYLFIIEEIDKKIAWMNETGNDAFNETEFKVWNVLNTVEDKSLSMNERVKLIAELIK